MKNRTVNKVLALTLTFVVTVGAVPASAATLPQGYDANQTLAVTTNFSEVQKLTNSKALDNTHVYLAFSEDIDFNLLGQATWVVEEKYGTKVEIPVLSAAQATLEQTELYDSNNDTVAKQETAAKRGIVLTLNGSTKGATLYAVTAENVNTADGGNMSTVDSEKTSVFVGLDGAHVPTVLYQKIDNVKAIDGQHIYVSFTEAVDFSTLNQGIWNVKEKYGAQTELTVVSAIQATAEQAYLIDANNDTPEEQAVAVSKGVVVELAETMKSATLYQLEADQIKTAAGENMSSDMNDKKDVFVGIDHALATPAPLQKVASAKALDSKHVYVEFTEEINFSYGGAFEVMEKYGPQAPIMVEQAVQATLEQAQLFNSDYDTPEKQLEASKKAMVVTLASDMDHATLYKIVAESVYTTESAGISAAQNDREGVFVGIGGVDDFEILAAVTTSPSTVEIYFDRQLDASTVENINNYEIKEKYGNQATLTVSNATFDASRQVIVLTVSSMEQTIYELKTFNLLDTNGNPQEEDAKVMFAGMK